MPNSVEILSDISQQEDTVTELIDQNFNWIIEKGLSYRKVIKLLTGTLDKMEKKMKEKIIKEVSEGKYEEALANLTLLNSTKELYKASANCDKEVYSPSIKYTDLPNSGTDFSTKTTESLNANQMRWAVLQAVVLEESKQRATVLDKAVNLLAQRGWPLATKYQLNNILSGLINAKDPKLKYINPQKPRGNGVRLTARGEYLLQSLTHDLK